MRLAEELGECISARGLVLLTGGRPAGVMAAACRGAAGGAPGLEGCCLMKGAVATGRTQQTWTWTCAPAWARPTIGLDPSVQPLGRRLETGSPHGCGRSDRGLQLGSPQPQAGDAGAGAAGTPHR